MIELQYARKGVIKMSFSSDLREELISVYDIIKTGKFDINKIKSFDSVRY